MAPQEVGDRCIITPSGYAVHSSRLGRLWITLLSCALAIRAPFLIRLSIIIRALIGYFDSLLHLEVFALETSKPYFGDDIVFHHLVSHCLIFFFFLVSLKVKCPLGS